MNGETLTVKDLGHEIKLHRDFKGISQQDVADQLGAEINRGTISHLEQASRALPSKEIVEAVCNFLGVPKEKWLPFFNPRFEKRATFETYLAELVGSSVSVSKHDASVIDVLEKTIDALIPSTLSIENSFDAWRTVLVFYSIPPLSRQFFELYLKGSRTSFDKLAEGIAAFQKDAIRLFSTIGEAFAGMNAASDDEFYELRKTLLAREVDDYSNRSDWTKIDKIPNHDLPLLGYIAAAKVRETQKKRQELYDFLREIAEKMRNNTLDLDEYKTAKKRRMDTFLREFESKIENKLFSPLFKPNADTLENEAEFVRPKEQDVERIEKTQERAYANLSRYLSADYLDVYVATSMRNRSDFISVNDFVETLFKDPQIDHLKLRYFNPTQSWIADRVAKGLVEALMLRRADICIYMAQKSDTFGKDSEASVTLGQGKPVIVYVPKLVDLKIGVDSEALGQMNRNELIGEIEKLSKDEIDEDEDNESLIGRLLQRKLEKCASEDLIRIARRHWADFDLEGEFATRVEGADLNGLRSWLTKILEETIEDEDAPTNPVDDPRPELSDSQRQALIRTLIAVAIRFESRATVFREVHPLALQVILSSRVLNGILVSRSSESCAKLVQQIVQNDLQTDLIVETENYKLVERETRSIIRVISRHKLISNSFETFYHY